MLCFFNVAAVFVMLGAEFLAVVQVIVYTGAILVLVLFVLMLVDPDDLPEFHRGRPIQRAVGLLLGGMLLIEVGIAIIDRTVKGLPGDATPENVAAVGGNAQAVGRVLYSQYLLPFEVVSLVLTVGVIGAIVLALPGDSGDESHVVRTPFHWTPSRYRPRTAGRSGRRNADCGAGRRGRRVGDQPGFDYDQGSGRLHDGRKPSLARIGEHMGELSVDHFLFLSAALFIIGMMGVLIRRNLLIIFMCVG